MVSDAVQRSRDAIIVLLGQHGGTMSPKMLLKEMEAIGYRRALTQGGLQLALSRGDVRVDDKMGFAVAVREAA